jgi:molecular chaperone DnaK
VAAINRALDELQRASQAMSEHLYAAPKPGAGPGDGPPPHGAAPGDGDPGPKPEDVIDVEFEEKK